MRCGFMPVRFQRFQRERFRRTTADPGRIRRCNYTLPCGMWRRRGARERPSEPEIESPTPNSEERSGRAHQPWHVASAARLWWRSGRPISRLHRALFYWTELLILYVQQGPPALAPALWASTDPRLVPNWPAGRAVDAVGGVDRLQCVAELCWISLIVAALAASCALLSPQARSTHQRCTSLAACDARVWQRVCSFLWPELRTALALERAAVLCCAPCFALRKSRGPPPLDELAQPVTHLLAEPCYLLCTVHAVQFSLVDYQHQYHVVMY